MIETCADFFYAFFALIDISEIFFKLIIPLFAAYFGAFLAYRNIEKKHAFDDEVQKLKETNKLILLISRCFITLAKRRELYTTKLEGKDGADRGFYIEPAKLSFEKIDFDLANVSFLIRTEKKLKKREAESFFNINLLDTSIENYNGLLELWRTRDEWMIDLKTQLALSKSGEDSLESIIKCYGREKAHKLLVNTESLIQLNESVLANFVPFIDSIKMVAKSRINMKLLEKKGYYLLGIGTEQERYLSDNEHSFISTYSKSDLAALFE
ncbi:hypothetical protein WH43_14320 [Rheinheimera sp. KL1]|uniref:hypothetical protein n=1 Tax=Rheinheimera sp. KL1 TaxID=1635005 RepID=UPI0006A9A279|nr:hypothetical protein [Rheinheimera sp. KL1]KOO57264.1 hypothetical protein WH43_14320 [Rheinheimera sp. KL1]